MKEIFAVFIVCVGLSGQATNIPTEVNNSKQRDEANRLIAEFLPKLQTLEEKYPNDPYIQLGLGVLYAKYATSESFSHKVEEQFQKVLKIDPNNRPAWAVSVKRFCRYKTARRVYLFDWLEGGIENAKKRNVEEITIPRSNPLYSTFKGEGNETVIISDFDDAKKQLSQKLDKELAGVFDIVNKAEKYDPENSLYNYLKAHLYFELGQNEPALEEISNAVQKKYLNTYFTEIRSAVVRVLQVIGFPEQLRSHIEDVYAPFGDFIRGQIWKKGLEPLSQNYEERGDVEHATEIYELTHGIARQIREEPLPYPSFFNPGFSQALEQWATRRQQNITKKSTRQEEKILGQNTFQRATYTIAAGLAVILIVGFIVLLKKKQIGRSR